MAASVIAEATESVMKYGHKCSAFSLMADYLTQQNPVETVFRMYDGTDAGTENSVNNKSTDCRKNIVFTWSFSSRGS